MRKEGEKLTVFACLHRTGLEMLREGKAPRAHKLVVRIDDTPAADVTHLGVRAELGWNGV